MYPLQRDDYLFLKRKIADGETGGREGDEGVGIEIFRVREGGVAGGRADENARERGAEGVH